MRPLVALAGLALLVGCGGASTPRHRDAGPGADRHGDCGRRGHRHARRGLGTTGDAHRADRDRGGDTHAARVADASAAVRCPAERDAPPTAPMPATNTPAPPTPPPPTPTRSASALVVRSRDADPANVRERPSSQAPVVELLQPYVNADVTGQATTDAQGLRWLPVHRGADGTNGYVRADVVDEPHVIGSALAGTRCETRAARPAPPDPALTNTPRGVEPDFIMWAVPQSLGGLLVTKCDAHYVRTSARYAGATECRTYRRESMADVVADAQADQRYANILFLALSPTPPRTYLQDVYTAIAYAETGNYLAQDPNDKAAADRARATAKAVCGQSCDVPITYYWQG